MSFFNKLFVNLFHFNRTNWKAVALCFLAATVFWFFNALNKNYTAQLRFPLRFEYDETRFAPARTLPHDLPINVSGNGWDLLRKTFGVKLPELVLPLERPSEVKKIVAGTLPALLAGQIENLTINYVAVDTLRIQIDPRTVRKFKLTANISAIGFRNNTGRVSPVVVLPDSVELNGPQSLLKALPDSIEIMLPARRVSENYREEVEVAIPGQEFIKRNPPVVEVRFEVAEMAELTVRVGIRAATPLPWGRVLETDSVDCVVQLPRKDANGFDNSTLQAVVAVDDLAKGETRKYLPLILGLPPYASLLRTDSVLVKQH
ncbi:MAG: hypothetical protein ACOYXA_08080 [Bacteroidota bacterium]